MTIYKNLLQSKQSIIVNLEDGVFVPMNDQLYSEWDNEYILYTLKPIFGSKEPVWLQAGNSDLRGLYIEDKDIVIFDPNHVEDFDKMYLTSQLIMIDSIDTLLYIEEQEAWYDHIYTYENMYLNLNLYSYFHPRNNTCKIDTSPDRFGLPYIDLDLPF